MITGYVVGLISNAPVITKNKQTQVCNLMSITEGYEATR